MMVAAVKGCIKTMRGWLLLVIDLFKVKGLSAKFKWFIDVQLLLDQISVSVYRVDSGKFYKV